MEVGVAKAGGGNRDDTACTSLAAQYEQVEQACIKLDKFHGEWNYTIPPPQKTAKAVR